MTKKYTKEELQLLAELRLARENKERSRAMPRRYYGDPSELVKLRDDVKERKR